MLLAHHFIPHLGRALLLLLGAGEESFDTFSLNEHEMHPTEDHPAETLLHNGRPRIDS